jgi:hypothetical protein
MADVWLKWVAYAGTDDEAVWKSCFSSAEEAQAQAAAEPERGTYLGIFDGPDMAAKKVADVKAKG